MIPFHPIKNFLYAIGKWTSCTATIVRSSNLIIMLNIYTYAYSYVYDMYIVLVYVHKLNENYVIPDSKAESSELLPEATVQHFCISLSCDKVIISPEFILKLGRSKTWLIVYTKIVRIVHCPVTRINDLLPGYITF